MFFFLFHCHLLLNHSERTEPVTSKQLRELFNSLEIKIPHDPLNESFASGIVHTDVHNLVTTVNSLSHGVELPTNKPSNTVLIFEMEVVYDYDQLWVVKKVSVQLICYISFFLRYEKTSITFLNISFIPSFINTVVLHEFLNTNKM